MNLEHFLDVAEEEAEAEDVVVLKQGEKKPKNEEEKKEQPLQIAVRKGNANDFQPLNNADLPQPRDYGERKGTGRQKIAKRNAPEGWLKKAAPKKAKK